MIAFKKDGRSGKEGKNERNEKGNGKIDRNKKETSIIRRYEVKKERMKG
jgi:hypothetical protein